MSDLAAFLAARIGEDEAAAKDLLGWLEHKNAELYIGGDSYFHDDRRLGDYDPARVLREAEAKRKILAGYEGWSNSESPDYWPGLDLAVRALAAVYSDHPDYLEEWRP